MKTRYGAVTLLALALITTGCSAAAEADPEPVQTTSAPSETPSPSPTPTPEPVVHVVGDTVTLASGNTVALLGYEPASAPEAPLPDAAGNHWVSIDVQTCNNSGEHGSASTSPWILRDSESRSFESSSVGYEAFPTPDYAWGSVDLPAGECIRGWITYPVLDGTTLTAVRYTAPTSGERIDWALG